MTYKYLTTSSSQTKKLGQTFAEALCGDSSSFNELLFQQTENGKIICLSGDLGAGKTTFAQGLLKGLKIKGPYTSPTFAIMKHYKSNFKFQISNFKFTDVYHIDAYRITAKDLIELGFKDFTGKKNSVTIIEWPENVKKIIPTNAVWINFEWVNNKERKIVFSSTHNSK